MPEAFASSRLRRLATAPARTAAAGGHDSEGQERCDLCAELLPSGHRHLLDVPGGSLACACRACALLFDRQEAGGSHYRLLPRRRLRLDGFEIDDVLWAGLGVPVDLAFFVRPGSTGDVVVGYPSPLGTLRSTVAPETWRRLEAAHPAVAGLTDDVEALLVNRARGAREQWLVPLDDCYRLVAVVRAHWKGLGGGPEVWEHVETFFRQLSAGPRPASEEETTWLRSR